MKSCVDCKQELTNESLFCSFCGMKQPNVLTCPKCFYPNESNSKFCQECGLNLLKKEVNINAKLPTVETVEPPPVNGITVEFPYSTAASFDFAVNEAQKFPNFKQFGEKKKAIYRVTFHSSEIVSITPLLEHLKGWRKRVVYVDGVKATWDSVFAFFWCYENKKSSYKPQFYCFGYENEWEFNLWGCVQARMPFRENAEWFCWGKWLNNQGDWEFDKKRIKHELEKELYSYRFCPALKFNLVEAVLTAIPNVVNPRSNKDWKFVETWGGDTEGLKMQVNRYGYLEQVVMKGVCPNGQGALQEIARKAGFQLP